MAGSKSRSKSPAAAPPSGGDLPIEELLVSAVLVGVAAYAVHAKKGTDVSLLSIKDSTLELLDSSSHGFDFNIPVRPLAPPRPVPPRAAVLPPGARPG